MRGDPLAFHNLKLRARVFTAPDSESVLREAIRDETFAKEERDQGRACENNYFLAHLGDAVIELAVRTHLRRANTTWTLQQVNEKADELVQGKALADRARRLSLGPALDLGKGGETERDNETTLARAFEATIGAAFLTNEYDAAAALALEWLELQERANAPAA